MNKTSIGFIGGGRVTRIILGGWRRSGVNISDTVVSDIAADALDRLHKDYPEIKTVADNRIPAEKGVVFIALHPPALRTALPELKGAFNKDAIVVSLAPVITFAELAKLLEHRRLVRMIPNAPSMIGRGFNPVAYSAAITYAGRQTLEPLFAPLGAHPEVSEADLEAYAILTAMGPTYFWFQWQMLAELGEKFGLKPEDVNRALLTMIEGAAQLLFNAGLSPDGVLDTIPLKPLSEMEKTITATVAEKLTTLYQKLKTASCEHLNKKEG